MIYALILPSKVPRFCLQVLDKNMIHSNASIAEAVLHLDGIFKKAYRTKNVVSIPKQWLNMTHPMFKDPNIDPILAEPQRPDTSFPPWRVDKYAKYSFMAYKKRIIFWGIIAVIIIVVVLVISLILYMKLIPGV
ncbi:MAG: hypothetical protein EZS28_030058 [Streblomastix strix]|uniref:Uncharacterized protein n=1 Tax=Streblomastix strix TaxID=222440 RepID=A0A5J4UXF3_9EUKA|nr:MAG: hypothetical protein EZS28_030058 [Streblomastix strix]